MDLVKTDISTMKDHSTSPRPNYPSLRFEDYETSGSQRRHAASSSADSTDRADSATELQGDLPDFDFTLRGTGQIKRPKSLDVRRSISDGVSGLSRLSSMISPTTMTRPSSPLNPSPKLHKPKSKVEMAEQEKNCHKKHPSKGHERKDSLPNTKSELVSLTSSLLSMINASSPIA